MKNKYQQLVNSTIPVSKAIGWKIQSLTEHKIHCMTQLAPNINIHQTGFAGSLFAAAMATGWTLLKSWSDSQGTHCELVAAEANIKYLAPVESDFDCIASLDVKSKDYVKLKNRLAENKSCGFLLDVEIQCQGKLCARLSIQFVFKC